MVRKKVDEVDLVDGVDESDGPGAAAVVAATPERIEISKGLVLEEIETAIQDCIRNGKGRPTVLVELSARVAGRFLD